MTHCHMHLLYSFMYSYVYVLDLYKLTDEVLGQGACAKVQGCVSLQNGQEYAVKVTFKMSLYKKDNVRHFEMG